MYLLFALDATLAGLPVVNEVPVVTGADRQIEERTLTTAELLQTSVRTVLVDGITVGVRVQVVCHTYT